MYRTLFFTAISALMSYQAVDAINLESHTVAQYEPEALS